MDPRVQQLMDLLGISEEQARQMLGLPPDDTTEPTAVQKVRTIIESLNGGFNGEVPNRQIDQEWPSDEECIYGLRVWEDGAPTNRLQRVRVTLEAMEDLVEPEADSASDQGILDGDTEEVAD